jgi:putative transposase
MTEDTAEALTGAIRVDEQQIRGHIDQAVRSSVEETLNGLLEAEADALCGAGRYERSADRVDTRAGHYERKLETKAGEVRLKVPKLRSLPFETAIIERYRRREASVEEALVEMYLAGVSVRGVEDITEALWGTRVSSGTVSRLNQKIYRHIEAWRTRRIEGEFPYLYLDGVVLKRSWAGEVRNIVTCSATYRMAKSLRSRACSRRCTPRRTAAQRCLNRLCAPSSNRTTDRGYVRLLTIWGNRA